MLLMSALLCHKETVRIVSHYRLDLKNLEETKNLMDSAAYEKFLQEES